jgi:hypothetical protein
LGSYTFGLSAGNYELDGAYHKIIYTRMVASMGERLIAEGVTVDTTSVAPITLTIKGLPAGDHTLLSFHNSWDKLQASQAATLTVTVDGKTVASNIAQTIRKDNLWESGSAYVSFTVVSSTQTVTFVFTPKGGNNKVYINGFEIDSPNLSQQVKFPSPLHRDERVGTTSPTLSWRAASVVSPIYNVYFGTSPGSLQSVAAGLTSTSTKVTANKMDTFYWRVDVISGDTTYPGRVFMFRCAQLAFPGAEGWGMSSWWHFTISTNML